MGIELYYAPSTTALASLIALEEAGAEYSTHRLDLATGAQRLPEYLKIHTRGQVPALVVDGVTITENIAILTYIACRFPTARLLPEEDAVAVAQAYEFLSWFATNLHVAIAQIWRGERFTDNAVAKEALNKRGIELVATALDTLERKTVNNKGDWLLGDSFTLSDGFALVISRWAARLDLDLARMPKLAAIANRVAIRPATLRALARERGD